MARKHLMPACYYRGLQFHPTALVSSKTFEDTSAVGWDFKQACIDTKRGKYLVARAKYSKLLNGSVIHGRHEMASTFLSFLVPPVALLGILSPFCDSFLSRSLFLPCFLQFLILRIGIFHRSATARINMGTIHGNVGRWAGKETCMLRFDGMA